MTDFDRGFIATPEREPISWVLWQPGMWFAYIAGFRCGTVIAGEESAFYRSVTGEGRMFSSLDELVAELTRIANWIVVANAEFCRRDAVYS